VTPTSRRIGQAIESLAAALLLLFQNIPAVIQTMGPMTLPVAGYVLTLVWSDPDFLRLEIDVIFFSERLLLGRIVALAGLVIFLIASVQFFRKRKTLRTSGIYAVIRHPQYLGLVVLTYGITIMCTRYAGVQPALLYGWLAQAFGYILLSEYEERRLLREYEQEYSQYVEKTYFIFPLPRVPKDLDLVVTVLIALLLTFLLTTLRR
jgi:protein-S-isoprenylcysteine O-methyltransferase Ste14